MSLTVVGSVAFDALETPFGKRERILGGAATHFSLAASFFTRVNAVGVVGGDLVKKNGTSSAGISSIPTMSRSFRTARPSFGAAATITI